MQVIEKPNKIKTHSSKLWLVYIMLILGMGILITLYINFQLTYKVNGISQKISELNSNQSKISNLPKTPYQVQEVIQPIEKKSDNLAEIKNSQLNKCLSLNKFIQDFYLMKLNAEKGNDFSAQVSELNQYISVLPELGEHLDNLLKLSPQNKNIHYFKLSFNNLIRDLYKKPDFSRAFHIENYIFIRAIGEKAIKNGGLDRQVALIEQALEENNLQKIDEYLEELPSDINSLNAFSDDLKNQLSIEDSLKKIEAILNNIMSK